MSEQIQDGPYRKENVQSPDARVGLQADNQQSPDVHGTHSYKAEYQATLQARDDAAQRQNDPVGYLQKKVELLLRSKFHGKGCTITGTLETGIAITIQDIDLSELGIGKDNYYVVINGALYTQDFVTGGDPVAV